MQEKRQFTFQRTIAISFSGKFPPDARLLSGLGFDSVSVGRQSITIRKSQPGIHPLPLAHLEITIKPGSAMLKISAPASGEPRLQELRAVATFLRVLSLFPACQASASELAFLALPSLDTASSVADAPYEILSKKFRDANDSLSALLAKNRALLRSSEEGVLASLELERQSAALSARIKKLEGISDESLLELVQDWLSSHHGTFNAALFSKTHNISPARAEEGLERLIASGAVRKVGNSFHAQPGAVREEFEQREHGIFSAFSSAFRAGRGKAKGISII